MINLTSWVHPKDVPPRIRPLTLHMWGRSEDIRTFFGDVFRTSSDVILPSWHENKIYWGGSYQKRYQHQLFVKNPNDINFDPVELKSLGNYGPQVKKVFR